MEWSFSLILTWMLTSTATALQCSTCTDQQCSTTATKTCNTETMCITASIQATSSGSTENQIYKDCSPSFLCQNTGSQMFSANFGFSRASASAKCCNTDNCNSQTLPGPSPQPPNSLQCFVFDPTTSQWNSTIQCSGEESSCFLATVSDGSTTYPILGCMTPNTCAAAGSLLPIVEGVGSITSGH